MSVLGSALEKNFVVTEISGVPSNDRVQTFIKRNRDIRNAIQFIFYSGNRPYAVWEIVLFFLGVPAECCRELMIEILEQVDCLKNSIKQSRSTTNPLSTSPFP